MKSFAGILVRVTVAFILLGLFLAYFSRPRIGTISGPHPYGDTRNRISYLKSALVTYQADLGRFPHIGTVMTKETITEGFRTCLGPRAMNNVLVRSSVAAPFADLGLDPSLYRKRWKGPYLDDEPEAFMTDSWNQQVIFELHNSSIWIHSAGMDKVFDPIARASEPEYAGNDIALHVMKLKLPSTNEHPQSRDSPATPGVLLPSGR